MQEENRLRRALNKTGITQQKLSIVYGIPLRTVEDWCGGKHNPPEYVLNLLLRCMAADFPVQDDTEEEIPKPEKYPYKMYNDRGKRLTQSEIEYVHTELSQRRVTFLNKNEENPEISYCITDDGFSFSIKQNPKSVIKPIKDTPPKVKPVVAKPEPAVEPKSVPENVCIAVDPTNLEPARLESLLHILQRFCPAEDKLTYKHYIALFVIIKGQDAFINYGYCDSITANSIIERMCAPYGDAVKIRHDYALENGFDFDFEAKPEKEV